MRQKIVSGIRDGEIAAARPEGAAVIVDDHPPNRVHDVGVLRRVDREESHRACRVGIAREQLGNVGSELVVSRLAGEHAVDVDADRRSVLRDDGGLWCQRSAEVHDRAGHRSSLSRRVDRPERRLRGAVLTIDRQAPEPRAVVCSSNRRGRHE